MTPREIADGLTAAARKVVNALSADWQAGPELPTFRDGTLNALRLIGVVEREFGDLSEEKTATDSGFRVRLYACWWFRLTPLGLAVRAILKGQDDGMATD